MLDAPTFRECLARVRAAGDDLPALTAAIADAERAATEDGQWLELAEVWLDRGDRAAARPYVDRAPGPGKLEIWPYLRRAWLLIKHFNDRAAALATLVRFEVELVAAGDRALRPAWQWVTLASSYVELFAGEDKARHCLNIAWTHATTSGPKRSRRDIDDLVRVASGYATILGERERGRELLEQAEAIAYALGEHWELWGVARVWKHALADRDRARAVLAAATAATPIVSTLTGFATAWRSMFDDEAQLIVALHRAETLAVTAADWLSIAEAWFDGGDDNRTAAWEAEGVRRALEHGVAAEAIAPDERMRTRIAAGYTAWLDDAVAADRVAPTMRAPEEVASRLRVLDGWDGTAPRTLLDLLRARITPAAVVAIAQADLGIAWTKHVIPLRAVVATGLQVPLASGPLEVLRTAHWVQGATIDHVARAFVCVVLAADLVVPGCERDRREVTDVLAPLLDSVWALTDSALDDALTRHLVWLVEVSDADLAVWPMLALILHGARRAPDDPRLAALVAELERREPELRIVRPEEGWLLRTTFYDRRHALWRELAAVALVPTRALPPPLTALAARLRARGQ